MADNDILVSELPSASQINTNDLVMLTQPNALSETGYDTKAGTTLQVFNKALKGVEYSTDLPSFTDKTVLGGLEELKGDLLDIMPVDTASGAIANFTTALGIDLVDCTSEIVATGGNGTPDNPNPIVGYSSANITRCGVNLWELSDDTKLNSQQCSYIYENNGVNITASGTFARIGYVMPVKVGETYTISFYGQGTANFINVYYGNTTSWGDSYGRSYLSSTRTKYTKTITANSNVLFVGFYATNDGTTGDMVIEDFMLEVGASASDFVAYNGQTYAISFGQTVYGGVLDVTRGKLHVTHILKKVSDISWTYRTISGVTGYIFLSNDITGIKAGQSPTMASCYAIKTNRNYIDGDGQVAISNNTTALDIVVKDDTYTSADDFVQNRGNETFVFELATPFDIDLTPVQIRALVGENNVFADTGSVEVKFKDTVQNYIDKKIAATQALIL